MDKPTPELLRELSTKCKGKAIDAFRHVVKLPTGFESDAVTTIFEATIRAAVLEVCALLEESTQAEIQKNKSLLSK